MEALSVAAYKKSLRGWEFLWYSSTKAGFVLSRRSARPGLLWDKPQSSKSPADGPRSPRSRRSASLPEGSASVCTFVFMSPRTSRPLKSSAFLGFFCGISRRVLCLFGTEAPFTRLERRKDSSKLTEEFTLITSLGTRPSLIPTSLSGRI